MRVERSFVAVIAVMLASACGGGSSSSSASASGGLVTLDGSSTVFPISEAVAEEFQRTNPGTRVTVGISGTGGGFQKFCRGETDISDASRPISPVEIEACKNTGIEYLELPIAFDGIAIAVNPKNNWATTITTAELVPVLEGLTAQRKISRSDERGYSAGEQTTARRPQRHEEPELDDEIQMPGGRKKKYYN